MTPNSEFLPPPHGATARYWLGAALIVLAGGAVGMALLLLWVPPRAAYTIGNGELRVDSRVGVFGSSKRFPLAAITSIEDVHLEGGRRQMGTAMPGFCQGRFSYPRLGDVWQATDCSPDALLLRVRGEDRPILLSPPERRSFREALQEGRALAVVLPRVGVAGPFQAFRLLILLLALPVAVLPALFFLAPGRLHYRVEGGVLHVLTWCGHKRFGLAGRTCRALEGASALKLAGSGVPGYYTGWYRMNGASTRVYATSLKEGVLVEGKPTVFVSPRPEERDAFLDALAANGARRA